MPNICELVMRRQCRVRRLRGGALQGRPYTASVVPELRPSPCVNAVLECVRSFPEMRPTSTCFIVSSRADRYGLYTHAGAMPRGLELPDPAPRPHVSDGRHPDNSGQRVTRTPLWPRPTEPQCTRACMSALAAVSVCMSAVCHACPCTRAHVHCALPRAAQLAQFPPCVTRCSCLSHCSTVLVQA